MLVTMTMFLMTEDHLTGCGDSAKEACGPVGKPPHFLVGPQCAVRTARFSQAAVVQLTRSTKLSDEIPSSTGLTGLPRSRQRQLIASTIIANRVACTILTAYHLISKTNTKKDQFTPPHRQTTSQRNNTIANMTSTIGIPIKLLNEAQVSKHHCYVQSVVLPKAN